MDEAIQTSQVPANIALFVFTAEIGVS